jgi:hypothetical protein
VKDQDELTDEQVSDLTAATRAAAFDCLDDAETWWLTLSSEEIGKRAIAAASRALNVVARFPTPQLQTQAFLVVVGRLLVLLMQQEQRHRGELDEAQG